MMWMLIDMRDYPLRDYPPLHLEFDFVNCFRLTQVSKIWLENKSTSNLKEIISDLQNKIVASKMQI
jgi:hypothetical protein